MIDKSYYDVLDKQVCPYCQTSFASTDEAYYKKSSYYLHCNCVNGCVKVMYNSKNEWRLLRIFLPKKASIEIWKDTWQLVFVSNYLNEAIILPHFNIFDCKRDEIPGKVHKLKAFI
jgi:hypothetical protein